ncbi:MAG: thioredoxin domain-containing protein [Colwellia sp.]|nr:thioredoxin domain-containing protein [Colwellia sp.]
MNKKTLFISVSLILIVAFIAAVTIFQTEETSKNKNVSSDNLNIIERENAPTKGSEDARVTIVEFFDPACETCQVFYPLVNDLIKKYPGKVKVMMRYAPFHQGSDQVVKLLEAAHIQGQFWPALDILFANQQSWTRHHVARPKIAIALLKDLPLDHEKFIHDASSDTIIQSIIQDVEDGKTLKVRATPQFFVNDKPLTNFGYAQLTQLVEQAIAEVY